MSLFSGGFNSKLQGNGVSRFALTMCQQCVKLPRQLTQKSTVNTKYITACVRSRCSICWNFVIGESVFFLPAFHFFCPCVREGHRLGDAAAWNKCPAIKSQPSSSQFRVPRRVLHGIQLASQLANSAGSLWSQSTPCTPLVGHFICQPRGRVMNGI